MPRVNRDLERRMAARRERERRRTPTERQYRFTTTTPPPAAEVDDELLEDAAVHIADSAPRDRAATAASGETRPKVSARPFTSYAAEYAYVGEDLRRLALVIGVLVIGLIILRLILPY